MGAFAQETKPAEPAKPAAPPDAQQNPQTNPRVDPNPPAGGGLQSVRPTVKPAAAQPAVQVQAGGQIILQQNNFNGSIYPSDPLPTQDELAAVVVSPTVLALIPMLDDPSYSARQAATRSLIQLQCEDDQLYAVLVREQLSPEQRQRLLMAVHERLMNRPRGALGIRRDIRWPNDVIVEATFPGMPAEQALKIGDKITQLDGQPLIMWDDLMRGVQRKRPGDAVKLIVLRPRMDEQGQVIRGADQNPVYEEMNVDLQLGSADDLDKFNDFGGKQPSAVQSERLNEARMAAIRFGLQPKRLRMQPGWDQKLIFGTGESQFGEPDDDPEVMQLLAQRKYLQDGMMQRTPELVQYWNQQIRRLQDEGQNTTLTEQERAFRLQVATRYREIVIEMLGR